MSELHWKTLHKCEFNMEDDFLESILRASGVINTHDFLNVSKKHTHDPWLFNNMDKAVELLHKCLGKKIYIKVDADVDGFTSAAYIRQFIETISPETEIVYGLNYKKEHGIFYDDVSDIGNLSLIIVPDAGSDSIKDCKEIQSVLNVPVLILDHHLISSKIYEFAVVVNCTDGHYPNSTLSGVGVVHKFCLAFCDKYHINPELCNRFIDLVSLGMIADSMDMRNLETRYYTLEGLKEENRRNHFIRELADYCAEDMKLGHTITSYGWTLAPKMNAVVRYGKPEEQLDLFRALCEEKDDREYQPRRKDKNDPKPHLEIHSLQKTMARVANNVKQRQDTEVRKFMEAIDKEIQKQSLDKNSVIIVDGTDILTKSTVTGLVANKLTSKYQRPVIMLKTYNEEIFGGSGRGYEKGTIEDFRKFLLDMELFDKCAGHPNAFGVELRKTNLNTVIAECNKRLKSSDLITIYEVDYEVKAKNLTNKMISQVANAYKIWGNRIEEPSFVITDIQIPAKEIVGYGDHNGFIKFKYNDIDYIKKYCSKTDFDSMTLKDRNTLGENKKLLDMIIIGNFTLNEYDGQVYPQVRIQQYSSKEYIPDKSKKTIDDDFIF